MKFIAVRSRRALVVAALIGGAILSCTEAQDGPVALMQRSIDAPMATEGEILINLWYNGVRITNTNYWVQLEPLGATAPRLHNSAMFTQLDPTQSYGFEWFDPASGEVGVGGCGGVDDYNADSLSTRGTEAHGGTGYEMHCVRPGQYRLNVLYGGIDGTLVKSVVVDYQQLEQRNNTAVTVTNGTTQDKLAGISYNPTGGPNSIVDLVVDIEVLASGSGDSPALNIDKAGTDPTGSTFNPVSNPSGTSDDYFRFSLKGSKTSWPDTLSFLAKYFWDQGGPNAFSTGYRDPLSGSWIINAFKHPVAVTSQATVTVGVDLKRPDEPEATTAQTNAQKQITITPIGTGGGPVSCIGTDGLTTWQTTDQYFRATVGCSTRGANIRYRWHFGVGDTTAFTADTLVDFRGHASTDDYLVTLEARDISAGLSGFAQQRVGVQAGAVQITGDQYISDKNTHYYYSNRAGYWFERFGPLGTWYGTTDGPRDSSFARIWPLGDYAVDVRQQETVDGILKRGLLRVEMCYVNCEPLMSGPALAVSYPWNVFGAGPVVSYGSSAQPSALQYYGLLGAHAANSPFRTSATALDGTGQLDLGGGGTLAWAQVPTSSPDVKLTTYALNSPSVETVFGMAYDFDLGTDAGDDSGGCDAERGMVFAFDKGRATGVLMRRGGTNAIRAVKQFGAKRFAPTTSDGVWKAQRDPGPNVLTGHDDVQFLISAMALKESTTFNVYLLRAADVTSLKALADQILSGTI